MLCALHLVLYSCASLNPGITYPIHVSKGACKGHCPVYEIKIQKNGNLVFIGRENTALIGERTLQLTRKEMASLEKRYMKIPFEKLDAEYDGSIYDLPKTTLSDSTRQVSYKRGSDALKSVVDYVKHIEEILTKNQLL